MYKKLLVITAFTFAVAGCAMMQKDNAPSAAISYTQHLAPIMQAKCTPCHYPERGKADMLDSYEAVRKHINDILYRVQLSPGSYDYMPYNQKKPGLTEAEIALFQQWKAEGFGE